LAFLFMLTKVNKFGNRTEVEQPPHDSSPRRVGSVAMVFPMKPNAREP